MLHLIYLALLFSLAANATTLHEIQEVRLAKAELALQDKNYAIALRQIAPNIESKEFHLESYIFLASIYIQQNDLMKAFKVYQLALKKHHTPRLFKTLLESELDDLLDRTPAPGAVGTLYFKLAELYYSHSKNLEKDKKSLALRFARKYFNVCLHYKIEESQSHLYLGLIERENSNHQAALPHLLKAQDYVDESDGADDSSNLTLLVADSLLQLGNRDAGLTYLRSIYFSPNANSSLQEYAQQYIDALYAPSNSFSFSGAYNYNNNIYSLTDEQKEGWAELEPYYYKKDAYSFSKSANYFHTNSYQNFWSYTANISFYDERIVNRKIAIYDTQTLGVGAELKYDNLLRSLGKLSYTFNRVRYRPSNESALKNYYDSHNIAPVYVQTLKIGTVSYKIPLTVTSYTTEEKIRFTKGLSLAYAPFIKTRFFAPTLTLATSIVDEGITYPDSKQSSLNISNHMAIFDRLNFFQYYTLLKNKNTVLYNSYSRQILGLYATALIPNDNYLSIYASTNIDQMEKENSDKISIWTYTLGFSVNF